MMPIYLTVLCGVLFLLALFLMNQSRLLKRNAHQIKEKFIQIDGELQKRNALIPQLIEISKKSLSQERETLEALVHSRNETASVLQKATVDPFNIEVMDSLYLKEKAFQEMYALFLTLISNQSMLCNQPKMIEILKTENLSKNKIQAVIESYNHSVEQYNAPRNSFIGGLASSLLGYKKATSLPLS